ncbi:RHS repeat protein [Bacteroidaceae bacterium HV4-6-C5C]|nr:RHS repeat protein [Bacteroidaceae bacterium HV4-6-C5C]
MRKLKALVAILTIATFVFGQNNAPVNPYIFPLENPYWMPPTPEVMSFMRYGKYSVNHSTGVPDISIPIYTIQSGDLTFPITLSYYAGGIKVDDISSTVGLGWTLNAGGAINRTIMDQPDNLRHDYILSAEILQTQETISGKKAWEHLLRAITYEVGSEATNAVTCWKSVDKEKDRYDYTVNSCGIGGSFIIDNGIIEFPCSDNQIKLLSNNNTIDEGFRITSPEGTSYHFTATESSRVWLSNETEVDRVGLSYNQIMPYEGTTAWFLTKIVSYNKTDSISFLYEDNISRGLDFQLSQSYTDIEPHGDESRERYMKTNSVTKREYDIRVLKEIRFNNGKIVFNYNINRSDKQVYRLSRMDIYNGTDIIRSVLLNNDNYFSGRRLKLNSVSFVDNNQVLYDSYSFDYHTEYNMPEYFDADHHSTYYYSQDLCGYYNGKANESLTHYLPLEHPFASLADRSFSFLHARTNTLKKISYITGGETEFIYDNYLGDTCRTPALRIKEIISRDRKYGNIPQDHKIYRYKDMMYRNTFGVDEAYRRISYSGSYESYEFNNFFNPQEKLHAAYSSSSDIPNFSLSMQCRYNVVEELTIGASIEDTIKTVYEYENPALKYEIAHLQPTNNPFPYEWGGGQTGPKVSPAFSLIFSREKFRQGNIISYLTDTSWKNSSLKRQTSYKFKNGSYIPVSEAIYNYAYYKVNDRLRIGTYVKGILPMYSPRMKIEASDRYVIKEWLYMRAPSIADYYFFDKYVSTGWKKLISIQKRIYAENIPTCMRTKEEYEYRAITNTANPHSFMTKKTEDLLTGGSATYYYEYPMDRINESVYRTMVDNNKISAVLFEKEVRYTSEKETKTDYSRRLIAGKELTLPVSVTQIMTKTYADITDNQTKKTEFIEYDKRGKVLYLTNQAGCSSVYMWGYNGQYPIAEIKNATYQQLCTFISSTMQENISGKEKPSTSDFELVNSLREKLPLSQITTFTYEPLVGILSITNPKGQSVHYSYDTAGRLQSIKDHEGRMLSKHEYNFRIVNP